MTTGTPRDILDANVRIIFETTKKSARKMRSSTTVTGCGTSLVRRLEYIEV